VEQNRKAGQNPPRVVAPTEEEEEEEITLHVSGALCTHHQEYIKTVDAITGTSHMSVWCRFKFAKRWS